MVWNVFVFIICARFKQMQQRLGCTQFKAEVCTLPHQCLSRLDTSALNCVHPSRRFCLNRAQMWKFLFSGVPVSCIIPSSPTRATRHCDKACHVTCGSHFRHSLCGDTVVVSHTRLFLIFPTINGEKFGRRRLFPDNETIRSTVSGCGVHLMTRRP